MSQYILNQPDKLTNFINNCNTKNINMQLIKNIEFANAVSIYVTLPSMLVDIINLYANYVIDVSISQKIFDVQEYSNEHNIIVQRLHMHLIFKTHLFRSTCCIKFKYSQHSSIVYKSLLNTIFNNDTFDYEISSIDFKDFFDLSHCDFRDCVCADISDCIRTDISDETDNFMDFNLHRTIDSNVFFNCFSKNTQQHSNVISYDPPRIKEHENCKYNKKLKCYDHILMKTLRFPLMIRYYIINPKKLSTIIAINKIFYEFINEQMINISHDHAKVQKLISNHIKDFDNE